MFVIDEIERRLHSLSFSFTVREYQTIRRFDQ